VSPEPYDRLILLPGLGADARMYAAQRERFPQLEIPDWLPPRPNETLVSYAGRFAESLAFTENCFIGGSSFGGMVAAEMANVVRPRKVLLIGSALSFVEIRPFMRAVSRLARWLPPRAFRLGASPSRFTSRQFGLATAEHHQLFGAMTAAASPEFIRWGSMALAGWPGRPADESIARLHGARDRMIPPRKDGSQTLIAEAGHTPTLTHPNDVNDWIEAQLVTSPR
jgi:pimeloyl-ACP methyl ester carboxylesterase